MATSTSAAPARKPWHSNIPGAAWGLVIAIIITVSSALFQTRLGTIQSDVSDIKQTIARFDQNFRAHELSQGHAGQGLVHDKDQEALTEAFRFQQDYLREQFAKVDERLTRIESVVRKNGG